ncbi:MAG: hypothetical protein M0R03_22485 [Novosphingobium sp.]|jgi:hypothetical protein|nr:hypothetical protein [Novosphingobium sp.]
MEIKERNELRQAVADYMCSEGCFCCQNIEAHKLHTKRLAELLDVPMYSDKSGYNFYQFRSPRKGIKNGKD